MAQAGIAGEPSVNVNLNTHESHGVVIDPATVVGFTLAFCFLPSALCLMAFPLLMYLHRYAR
jgi:hypothetical protein